jgi:hypothetical protein
MVGPYPHFYTNYEPNPVQAARAKKWTAIKVSKVLYIKWSLATAANCMSIVPFSPVMHKSVLFNVCGSNELREHCFSLQFNYT